VSLGLLAACTVFAPAFGAPLALEFYAPSPVEPEARVRSEVDGDSARAGRRVAAESALMRAQAPEARAQLVLYAVRVNRQDLGVIVILRLEDGSLYARRADLESWRLRLPDSPALVHAGEEYFLLNALPGYQVRADAARQTLDLDFSAQAFAPTLIGFGPLGPAVPTQPGWGGFANYDFFGTRTASAQTGSTSRIDGLLELGMFSPRGVLVSNALAQNVSDTAVPGDGNETRRRLVRLETTWTRDLPNEAKSLQLGDTIGKSGIWGRPVRYGGLRWGTNFATQPGFVTLPLPAIGGEAALPSTTELYIDGILRQRGALPPGPFQLSNLPAVTGQGEARLVVRDILGREQVITQPYYASSLLLKEGLRDDSYEIGFVRDNFGLRDNDYGRFVGATTLRQGLTDRITAEFRGEVLRNQQTAGVGASIITPLPLVLTAAGALSQSEAGAGGLGFLAVERQARGVGYGVRSQWTSAPFTQLGIQPGQAAPRQLLSASLGFPLGPGGSLGMSYVRQLNRGQADNEIAASSYSLRLGKTTSLNFSATTTLSGDRARSLGITLVSAFTDRISAVASHTTQSGANQTLLQLQQNLPPGSGFGYRLLAGNGASGERKEAGLSLQTDTGAYTLDAGETLSTTSYRLSAGGGVALVEGRTMLSRRIGDAFAIVEVPEYADVGVYVSNQVVARTDKQGVALVPRLLPYQNNPVRVDPTELPLDAQIDATQVNAVPYFRSGLVLKFPVKHSAGALLVLALDDGAPMPLGTVVTLTGEKEEFPVAERGEVYVTGLAAVNRLQATWRGQTCAFSVEVPPDAGPVPRLGPFKCSGVKR